MFSLKKDFKVYIDFLDGSSMKRISVTDSISFSKVFEEKEIPKKTLHNLTNYYAGGKVVKSNQANFSFTVELTRSITSEQVLGLIFNLTAFTLHVSAKDTYYHIPSAYITNCVFIVKPDETIKLELQGTGSTLTIDKIAPTPLNQTDWAANAASMVSTIEISFNGIIQPSVKSVYLELATGTTWVNNQTVHSTMNNNVTTLGPASFVVQSRQFTGNFYSYHLGDTSYPDNFSDSGWTSTPININITSLGSVILQFLLSSTVGTSRIATDDVLSRAFDFRLSS